MTHPGQPGIPPAAGPSPGQPVPPEDVPPPDGWRPSTDGQHRPGPSQAGAQGFSQPGPSGPGQFGPGPSGPGQAGYPGGPVPTPAGPSGKAKRIGGIAVAVAIAVGVAAFRFVDVGAPDVGDCVMAEGVGSFDTVDCDDSEAQYRVVGVLDGEVSEAEFDEPSYQPCGDFPTATAVLWSQNSVGDGGTVYCAATV
jgi:hypothetical protein